jgi:adenylylsulfate kinase
MAIQWIYGESGSGKTTLAKSIQAASTRQCVLLDGDDMRRVWTDLGYSDEDRETQNTRVAHLARVLARQGFDVVVATICPTPELRKKVQQITGAVMIQIQSVEDQKKW